MRFLGALFAPFRAWWRWAGQRTTTRGKWLAYGGPPVVALIVVIIIAGTAGGAGDGNGDEQAAREPTQEEQATEPPEEDEPTEAPEPTEPPEPTDTPEPTWETGPVTEDTVREALGDLDDLGLIRPDIDAGNVTFLSVIPDVDGDGFIVAVEFKPGEVLGETDFLTVAGESTVIAWAKLFANPQVHRVKISAMADLIDALGNESTEFLTSATLNRATADQVNWQGLADRQLLDNKHVFCISDEYIIRPLIYNELRDTGCLTGPSR